MASQIKGSKSEIIWTIVVTPLPLHTPARHSWSDIHIFFTLFLYAYW